jgi:hypothetical protein
LCSRSSYLGEDGEFLMSVTIVRASFAERFLMPISAAAESAD